MTKIERLIKKAQKLINENGDINFTISDNCPGDGWDGRLTEKGCYVGCDSHFEGEFFSWETSILQNLLPSIIEACENALKDTTYANIRLYKIGKHFACQLQYTNSLYNSVFEAETQAEVLDMVNKELNSKNI